MRQSTGTTSSAAKHSKGTAAEFMRPATTSVEPHAHVAAAAYLMKRAGTTALVVTPDDDRRRPVAIVTDTDVANVVADGQNVDEIRISDIKKRAPITVPSDTPVTTVAELMLTAGIHHMIVTENESVVGILDMADVCRGLLPVGEAHAPTDEWHNR
jgi:CBS domain-containing protein